MLSSAKTIPRRQDFPMGAVVPSSVTDYAFFCRPVRAVQQDAEEKSSDFTSGVYYPELVRTMGGAFDAAWEAFKPTPKNAELARLLMASAIIEAVEAGAREHELLVDKAIRALRAAIKADREALDAEPTALAAAH